MIQSLAKIKKIINQHQHGLSTVTVERIDVFEKTVLCFRWDEENSLHSLKKYNERVIIDFLFEKTSIKKRRVFFDKLNRIEILERIDKFEKYTREAMLGFYGQII